MNPTSTTSYNSITREERELITSEIRAFWTERLKMTPYAGMYIIPKMVYVPKGMIERAVRCFNSELSKGDILLELVSSQYVPVLKERQLYILHHRTDFKTHFVSTDSDSFIIPVSELQVCVSEKEVLAPEVSFASDNTNTSRIRLDGGEEPRNHPKELTFVDALDGEDDGVSSMTIRDLFAILTSRPVSNKIWLNNLIKAK